MVRSLEKPNIVLIVMDSVRYDCLSCYGYQRETAPNIDNIANEGVIFENCISPAESTITSIAALLTGTYLSQRGCNSIGNQHWTLAEVLNAYGYETLGYSDNGWVSHATGMDRGFQSFEEIFRYRGSHIRRRYNFRQLAVRVSNKIAWLTRKKRHAGAYVTNQMVKSWLEQHRNPNSPFFLFIHYNDAHYPYEPPKPYNKFFFKNHSQYRRAIKVNQDPYKYIAQQIKMNEEFCMLKSLYDGGLLYLDSKIGEMIDCLNNLNLLDNTLLIIIADHGENFGEHQLMGHMYCLYDTLLHVPMIIRYPKLFPPKTKSSQLVQSVDIFPTILDIIGTYSEFEEHLQGYSLLKQDEGSTRPFAIAELPIKSLSNTAKKYPGFDWSSYERELKCIRTKRFKYIWSSNGKDELYDIIEDATEENNLIESHHKKAAELKEQLFSQLSSFKTDNHTEDIEIDKDLKKHLAGLGYIT